MAKYMTRKEYEEKSAAIGKEIDKYGKRGLLSALSVSGSLGASALIPSIRPYGILAAFALMTYTTFGPVLKMVLASNKQQKIKKQLLGELEQIIEELEQRITEE